MTRLPKPMPPATSTPAPGTWPDLSPLHRGRFLAYVRFSDASAPSIYLLPTTALVALDAMFVSRDYTGLCSPPEYGLQLTPAKPPRLEPFCLDPALASLISGEGSDDADR